MQKSIIFFSLTSILSANAISNISPLKDFAPPTIIKPFDKAYLENQFDLTKRTYLDDELLKTASFTTALFQNSLYNSFLFRHKAAKYYSIFNIRNTKANNYKEPSGKKINFAYKRFSLNAIAGFTPNEYSDTKFGFIKDDLRNDLQPQFVMDPVKTVRNIYIFNQRLGENDLSNTINIGLKYINLERIANNYDFRKALARMRMQINRKILSPNISYDIDLSDFHFQLGLNYSKDKHIAKRFMNDILNAYKFADVRQTNYEIYTKNKYKINDISSIDFDISYWQNKAKTLKAKEKIKNPAKIPPYFPNANMLWQKYYAKNFNNIKQSALNFKIAYDYNDELNTFNLAFARLARVPNNNERFTAIAAPKGAQVSNPFIKPEFHNIISLKASSKNIAYKGYLNSPFTNGFKVGASISADKVKDLIIYNKANNGTLLTKNVDANIFKLNLNANYNFARYFGTKIEINYARGQNTSDKEPLYQIKPLELIFNLDYKNYFNYGTYRLGTAYRYSFRQSRIASLIDKDIGGFAVLDLYANIKLKDRFSLSFGINNLLNKNYIEFISPSHVENFEYKLISAPARQFYVKFNTTF